MKKLNPYGELDTFPVLRGLSLSSIFRNAHKTVALVTLFFMFVQPAIGKDIKPDLPSDDCRQIMQLADRVEAAFLIPDALLLLSVVRPKYGLFIDLLSDSSDPVLVRIPFSEISNMFSDFEKKYWGPHDAADFDLYGAIPYVILNGSIHLIPSFPDVDKHHYSQILSLPDAFSHYDSKEINRLTVEPMNHVFVYEDEHYVQYFVQGPVSEIDGEFWFLIVDKDDLGWFLKGITHMELWTI